VVFYYNKLFSVKQMYVDYKNLHSRFMGKSMWTIRVPLKIKTFRWFLHKKVLLTMSNLAIR
jgi:hypothetical protein